MDRRGEKRRQVLSDTEMINKVIEEYELEEENLRIFYTDGSRKEGRRFIYRNGTDRGG